MLLQLHLSTLMVSNIILCRPASFSMCSVILMFVILAFYARDLYGFAAFLKFELAF